ncbi:MAG: hypothetical protein LAT75_12240 [Candidatus Cyclonatronum sp.]|uniref:hypothetical protein n=1 Tax=Cyclonatronum sp. TaxID=3024185 RepID=UPI0025C14670|nr:hypothetical protein [Cyclonatronum sp.]MCC5934938.1 hypothetical protein [Balneolales bacterium]MCH8487629.1 hypothetical protein [Cyclonatronum sp.]
MNLEDKYRPAHIPLYYLVRRIKWDQFFVGLFGAFAIFGVLMKLWQPPFWGLLSAETGDLLFQIFMPIGFLGECVVFIIMGFVKGEDYEEVHPESTDIEFLQNVSPSYSQQFAGAAPIELGDDYTDKLKKQIQQQLESRLDKRLDEIVEVIAKQAETTTEYNRQMNALQHEFIQLGTRVARFGQSVEAYEQNMGSLVKMQETDLSARVETLDKNLRQASESIAELDKQIKQASQKFDQFNRR